MRPVKPKRRFCCCPAPRKAPAPLRRNIMHDDNARQRTINSWNDTLRADKRHHLEYTQRSQTLPFFFLPLYLPGSHPSVHLVAFWPSCFSVLAPLVRSVGPFLLRSGPISGSSFPACPPFYLCCSLGSSWPLVHLSIDAAGALGSHSPL